MSYTDEEYDHDPVRRVPVRPWQWDVVAVAFTIICAALVALVINSG